MQKNQYKKYKQLLKIRDRVILVVLVLVGIFYYLSLPEEDGSEAQMYRAETVRQDEDAEVTTGTMHAESAAETAGTDGNAGATNEAVSKTMENAEVATTAEDSTATGVTAAAPETDGSVSAAAGAETGTGTGDRINLNTASLEELDSLPGIGPATAKLILEYRQQYGGFAAPEEIMNVKRIGEKTYEKLKDRIRV